MKKTTMIGFMALVFSNVYAGVTQAPVKHLYVPRGFDSNDSIEVVVAGEFPNPCYSRNTVSVEIDKEKVNIHVTAIGPDSRLVCPQVMTPFKEVVSLGNLQGGDYQITVNNTLRDSLKVLESTSRSVDDNIYADIDRVEVKGNGQFVLHGWRYSHCIDLDKIKVISNNKDTLSVLPIMKQVDDFCPMKMTPIAYAVKLDVDSLMIERPLIHVRTMDGKSYNKILNQEERK